MNKRNKEKNIAKQLKKDLKKINQDWHCLLKKPGSEKKLTFLAKVALDIKTLDHDAHAAENIDSLKEYSQLIQHILSTPWGAPFVGETTLLDAALTFSKEDFKNSELSHLLSGFFHFSNKTENPLFKAFEELDENFYKRKF